MFEFKNAPILRDWSQGVIEKISLINRPCSRIYPMKVVIACDDDDDIDDDDDDDADDADDADDNAHRIDQGQS